jgi:hypothetical protein
LPSIRGESLLREVAMARVGHGASSARQRFRQEALALVERENLIQSTFSYRIVDLDESPTELLKVGGEALYAPRLLPEAGGLTALAFAVVTLGPLLEQRVTSLFAERCVSLALALDDVGNQLLFVATRRVQHRMLLAARKRDLMMAGELRPGDPGLALEAQKIVLRLADASTASVCLTRGHALRPLKSTSMVLGVGIDLPPARWSRCDVCPSRPRCQIAGRAAEIADA